MSKNIVKITRKQLESKLDETGDFISEKNAEIGKLEADAKLLKTKIDTLKKDVQAKLYKVYDDVIKAYDTCDGASTDNYVFNFNYGDNTIYDGDASKLPDDYKRIKVEANKDAIKEYWNTHNKQLPKKLIDLGVRIETAVTINCKASKSKLSVTDMLKDI